MTKTWTVVLVTIQMTAELVLGTGGTGPLARIKLPYLPEASISVLKAAAPVSARSEEAPIALESHRQLFVDDFLISESEGVERRLNQPRKYEGNPVLSRVPEGEEVWEAGMPISFSSVLHDPADGLFKLWYSLHAGSGGDEESVLCFARSTDGIRWNKPRLGKFRYRETMENNIVVPHGGLASGVFLDPHEADPSKRFKMLHMRDGYKIYASYSADGLQWTPYNDGKAVFFESPGHDSQMVAYWDEALGLYVGIIRDRTGRISQVRPRLVSDPEARAGWRRHWDPRRNRAPENHSIRRVSQIMSRDFVHWNDYRVIVGPDAEDPLNRDQFYNMEVMTYEGLRIGLVTVFSYDPDYCRGAVQLTSSRDGRTWDRAGNRSVFIPLSNQPGDFDWGAIYPLQGPFVYGDEIRIYYSAGGVDHNHTRPPGVDGFPNGIGLAKLRLDGFVSVQAGKPGGSLTTRSFTFTGDELVVNADAGDGRFLVEVLDQEGKPVHGYTREDCDPLRQDALRQTVTWNGRSAVTSLTGKPIRLRFHLEEASLYSFEFLVTDATGGSAGGRKVR